MSDAIRDALDHIRRVARQGISPTKRLDWIEIRARYALEGKPWSNDIRETPRDSVKKMEKDFAECRAELAALKAQRAEVEPRGKGPHRAHRLTVLLEADSKEDLMRGLDSFGQALARDELTKGTWGSPSHGAIYEYLHGDSPTHDEYFEQTRAYLETLRDDGPGGGS